MVQLTQLDKLALQTAVQYYLAHGCKQPTAATILDPKGGLKQYLEHAQHQMLLSQLSTKLM